MDGRTYDSVELPGLAHQLLLEPAVLLKLRSVELVGVVISIAAQEQDSSIHDS